MRSTVFDDFREWALLWLAYLLFRKAKALPGAARGACANRTWVRARAGRHELAVTVRDCGEPDGFSREELVRMLAEVRRHEALQGWRVPEPLDPPTAGAPS